MKISNIRADSIITHALGSCLGITAHDPVACVGSMIHVMLPLSTIAPSKAEVNPFMFVDTGVPKLFLECYKAGARKEHIVVTAVGGANPYNIVNSGFFRIGEKNFLMLKAILKKCGIPLKACDVGGTYSRTMSLEIGSGKVTVAYGGRPGAKVINIDQPDG